MTSELRPAVEVWDDAIAAWAADTIDTRQAAAAVIQDYGDEREAKGRAEQAAELAKFKALAETLAGALEDWTFRYYWRHEGMLIEQARIHAKTMVEMMLRQYKEARDAS